MDKHGAGECSNQDTTNQLDTSNIVLHVIRSPKDTTKDFVFIHIDSRVSMQEIAVLPIFKRRKMTVPPFVQG